jgi:RAP domain
VLGFHPGCYSVNSSRLRGNFGLLVRSLESLGYSVVPVSVQHWSALLDQEKIPYLMQNIKIKCEALQQVEAVQ